jgi:aspartate racemase
VKKFEKTIGIVGGAGPVASAFLYRVILEACQKRFGSNDYCDFPEIIIVSYPFIREADKIKRDLSICFDKLKKAGASIFCIACNTFHAFLPNVSDMHFVHLIQEGLKAAYTLNIRRGLVLASQRTIASKLYEQGSMECIYPSQEDQEKVQQMIREVTGGTAGKEQADILKAIIAKHSVDGVILACTELPVIHRAFPLTDRLPIVDTVEVLANTLVSLALHIQGKGT